MATAHPIKKLQWLPAAYRVIISAFKVLSSICPKPLFSKPHLSNYSISLPISFALADACSVSEADSLKFGIRLSWVQIPILTTNELPWASYWKAPGLSFLSRKDVAMRIKWDNEGTTAKCLGYSENSISTDYSFFQFSICPLATYSPCVIYLCLKHLPLHS